MSLLVSFTYKTQAIRFTVQGSRLNMKTGKEIFIPKRGTNGFIWKI